MQLRVRGIGLIHFKGLDTGTVPPVKCFFLFSFYSKTKLTLHQAQVTFAEIGYILFMPFRTPQTYTSQLTNINRTLPQKIFNFYIINLPSDQSIPFFIHDLSPCL